jgi:hypothetical protein
MRVVDSPEATSNKIKEHSYQSLLGLKQSLIFFLELICKAVVKLECGHT